MLFENVVSNLPDWYKKILQAYQLSVFVITNGINVNFFKRASDSKQRLEPLFYVKHALYKKIHKAELFSNSNFVSIVICCSVSKLQLGQLICHKKEESVIWVDTIASMRGVINQLRFPKEIGTKIGSLLITSLTLLLDELKMRMSLKLTSYPESRGFYEGIGMRSKTPYGNEFSYFGATPFPGYIYYDSIVKMIDSQNSNEFKIGLYLQRHWRHYQVLKVCSVINQLIEQMMDEAFKLEEGSLKKRQVDQFLLYFLKDDQISLIESDMTRHYLIETFNLKKYYNNPFIKYVVFQALGVKLLPPPPSSSLGVEIDPKKICI